MRAGFPLATASLTDLLERPLADAPYVPVAAGGLRLDLRPFQIVTVRLAPDA